MDNGIRQDMPEYLLQLNEVQRKAVLHEGAPLLILAGAGSGKTRVITTKIAYLVDQLGVDPRSILAVTFTNKAAREMLDRVSMMVPGVSQVMIRTFHSFGAWLLRRNAHLLNLHSRFSIYDDDDVTALLQGIRGNAPKRDTKRFARWISRAKDYCLHPDDDLDEISHDPEFPDVYREYRKRMEEMGNVDFGDLILRCVDLLEGYPEVRKRIRQRFRVILVDEYQDSNVAQFQFLRLLTGPDTYFCVVGDDDQSIYRFRGAEVRNILSFPDTFPGTEVIRLEENYRSTGTILKIASEVVRNNRERLGKTLWTRKGEGAKGQVVFLQDEREEAEFCVQLLQKGNPGGTAILYRTNAQSRQFEITFARNRIPFRIVGALSFYSREEVKDVLSLLALVQNPRDEVAFKRIVNKPGRGIGKVSIGKILEVANGSDLLTGCRQASLGSKASKEAVEFTAMIEGFVNDLSEEGPSPQPLSTWVQQVISESGLLDYHRIQDDSAGTGKVKNLEELVGAAADYVGGGEGLAQFLEDIGLDRSRIEGGDEDEGEKVTLITMHNTKGLEFDRVIVTGMEEGLFPSLRENSTEREIEEERRLFYVSITRARNEIYFTACKTRRLWGRIEYRSPSPFLEELPVDYIEGELKTDEDEWPPGTGVYHDEYGSGAVIKQWSNGRETIVLVRFETGVTAQFIPKYSPLERMDLRY